jgi:tRNA (cytidine/uridine-2'-O-)-methyltransferase
VRLAFYHPEIPHNTGALLRVAACLGVPFDLIGPLGFVLSDRRLQRASMDYQDKAQFLIHASFEMFLRSYPNARVVALIAKGNVPFTSFSFVPSDILLLGPESTGLPMDILQHTPHHVTIPMQRNTRSLNAAIAGSIVLAEALRQCSMFPTGVVE